jgi:protein gp37
VAETTGIEWCDSTLGFWQGCTRVSEEKNGGGGCDNCYAERMNKWLHRGENWGPGAPRLRILTAQRTALSWQRNAAKFRAAHGRDRRVFVNSMADWLDNEVPTDWRIELLDTIRQCPDVTFLLLSKRIGNWKRMLEQAWNVVAETWANHVSGPMLEWIEKWLEGDAPANVWIGTTVVNQAEADRDIPKLLAVPARVRFLSIEPMLGPIDLHDYLIRQINAFTPLIDWIIVGAESGPQARPAQLQWIRSIVKQCKDAGVACMVKQLGNVVHDNGIAKFDWPAGTKIIERPRLAQTDAPFSVHLVDKKGGDIAEWPEDLRVREFPDKPWRRSAATSGLESPERTNP